MNNVDLHLHSAYSRKGQYSVLELIKMAQEARLEFAAIADDDSIQSIKELRQYKDQSETRWISAVKLSVHHHDSIFQLLAYGIDEHLDWFEQHEQKIKLSQEKIIPQMIQLLNDKFSFNFSFEQIRKEVQQDLISQDDLVAYILNCERFKDHPELKKFKERAPRYYRLSESFKKQYLCKGKAAYVALNTSLFTDAIAAIHEAGGIAVLAYPGQSIKENQELLLELITQGLDGIECYSPYHSEIQNVFYVNFALKHDLLISCGSDFGYKFDHLQIGNTHCPIVATDIIKAFEKRGLLF